MRGARPFVFTNLRAGEGVDAIVAWIKHELTLDAATA
jgi:urease accessory protein